MSSTKMRLQINTNGAWRNVSEFHGEGLRAVLDATEMLWRAIPGATFQVQQRLDDGAWRVVSRMNKSGVWRPLHAQEATS